MTALLFWTVLGGLVGGVAKSTVWFDSPKAWLWCILFGAIGGTAGGYLRLLAGASNGFDLSSMGLIIVGAAAALSIYSLFPGRVRKSEVASYRKAA